jgi:hypothetical protein
MTGHLATGTATADKPENPSRYSVPKTAPLVPSQVIEPAVQEQGCLMFRKQMFWVCALTAFKTLVFTASASG